MPKPNRVEEKAAERLLRLPEVESRIGMRRTWIYSEILAGRFERPRKLGRASVWPESSVNAWIADRIAEHGERAAP